MVSSMPVVKSPKPKKNKPLEEEAKVNNVDLVLPEIKDNVESETETKPEEYDL